MRVGIWVESRVIDGWGVFKNYMIKRLVMQLLPNQDHIRSLREELPRSRAHEPTKTHSAQTTRMGGFRGRVAL